MIDCVAKKLVWVIVGAAITYGIMSFYSGGKVEETRQPEAAGKEAQRQEEIDQHIANLDGKYRRLTEKYRKLLTLHSRTIDLIEQHTESHWKRLSR